MNEVEILRKLAAAAARERVPGVDVVGEVIRTIGVTGDDVYRPLAWVAGFSLAAALPMVVLAYNNLEALTDPLQEMFFAFAWMTL